MSIRRFILPSAIAISGVVLLWRHPPRDFIGHSSSAVPPPTLKLHRFPRVRSYYEQLNNVRDNMLIIGGGATGDGVPLHAAPRGLKAVVVERDDFSSTGSTSSKSIKLIHGGVYYLKKRSIIWIIKSEGLLLRR
uniref:glycerol-3-phosphate dehydrogenase n=1 Tax=Fusarium acuminatum CS5907 TaxID=1318461 RepID=A0A096PFF3_9HYPO|nr:unnamed protein product [Fusarium acuminatum CS5907]